MSRLRLSESIAFAGMRLRGHHERLRHAYPRSAPTSKRTSTRWAVACAALFAPVISACGSCESGPPAPASGNPPQGSATPRDTPPAAQASYGQGVTVRLHKRADATVISFGLPVPPGITVDPQRVRVRIGGNVVTSRVDAILYAPGKDALSKNPRALLVQLPASAIPGAVGDAVVTWLDDANVTALPRRTPYAETRRTSPFTVAVAERAIELSQGRYQLVEKQPHEKELFSGWEPSVLATYPPGYLAATGVLGENVGHTEVERNPSWAGIRYLSDNFGPFTSGAMYDEGYAVKPEAAIDPIANFEGWLYDRCATFLLAYAHVDDSAKLRHGYQSCSYYLSLIRRTGPDAGTFGGKPEADLKYSHLRGVYAYFALTGDEDALVAGKLIAEAWLNDDVFLKPYRQGHARGADKLFTERLLAVSIETMVYAYLLLGDARYLTAARELFETAYRHITTQDRAQLQGIIKVDFPPQDCFVHSALQHGEGNADEPWCSGWMAEMLVDPLLRYTEITGDTRTDEIFIRLGRSLRDRGTNYFHGNPLSDSFLAPKECYAAGDEEPRMLVPLYGFGMRADGSRAPHPEYEDAEHCPDATALTAAAIRGLKRTARFDGPGVGPFKTEGASMVALHEELTVCADRVLKNWVRKGRDPRRATSEQLAEAYSFGMKDKQNEWLESQHIGYPWHVTTPQRKLSWWFNGSLEQYRMLADAGVSFPSVRAGWIQPAGCAR